MKKTSKQLCKNRQSWEKSESRLTDDRNDARGKPDKFLFVLLRGQFKTGPHCHQKPRENKTTDFYSADKKAKKGGYL